MSAQKLCVAAPPSIEAMGGALALALAWIMGVLWRSKQELRVRELGGHAAHKTALFW